MNVQKSLLSMTIACLLSGTILTTGGVVYASEIEGDTVTENNPGIESENNDTVLENESDIEFESYLDEILYSDEVIIPEEETDEILFTEEEQNEIINSTVAEVQATATVIPTAPGQMQTRGVASLMTKLIIKYGAVYVKKTLPKLIYKKIASQIGKKVTEAKFVSIWGRLVDLGTYTAIEKGLAKILVSMGVNTKVANGAASVVVVALNILI